MVGQFMECCSLHRVALSLAHEYTVFSGSCCAEEETDEDRKKEKLNKWRRSSREAGMVGLRGTYGAFE